MPKVFVPNRSHHDFADAARFGDIVYLTDGIVNRFQINQIYRQCKAIMKDATEQDFILVSSLSIINAIAASIMARRFNRVNFLIFNSRDRRYEAREIIVENGD